MSISISKLPQLYNGKNSQIYLSKENEMGIPVIIKVLSKEFPTTADVIHFNNEFEYTKNSFSSGIRKAFKIDEIDGKLSLFLEYIEGISFNVFFQKNTLKLKDFLLVSIKLSKVIGEVHQNHFIHKDINGNNILINPDTLEVKLIDFGIASKVNLKNQHLGNPEHLEGTLAYISPEQTGRMNRSIDYRSDLYSLGIVLYEVLTGKLPFQSSDAMEMVHAHIAQNPSTIEELNPEIPPVLSRIVEKLMEKNAEDRYQSAYGLQMDLEKCLKSLDEEGKITGFSLGEGDFSGKFHIPEKLYGRKKEINTLLKIFEKASHGNREMVLVDGYSGVGKSALVSEIHKPITEKRGYFVSGKYDQFQKGIPYSAIIQAFDEFCDYLLTLGKNELEEWKEIIQKAIGQKGKVLTEVIPNLELILGEQPKIAKLGPQEAQNRFNSTVQDFVFAISTEDHPLVMFLDDLQWVDLASLHLLNLLMTDEENKHFLLICAFRDNEVDDSHPFIETVNELRKTDLIIDHIHLDNLKKEDVEHLISDAINSDDSKELLEVVYKKTHGNAFFTHQILKSIYEEELLKFDHEEKKWNWDINKINQKNITANVVELMAQKIEKLPSSTQEVLKLAACIGNHFNLKILATVAKQSLNDVLSELWEAVKTGLIYPTDENYKLYRIEKSTAIEDELKSFFKFTHDRIQQAAYSLIEEDTKKQTHYNVGNILLNSIDKNELEEQLFDIVNHLNMSIELIKDEQEGNQLAELNLRAGKKAKESNAYEAATKYLADGIKLLSENPWVSDYRMTCDLYLEKAESEYLNTNFEETQKLYQIITDNAVEKIDLAKIYDIMIVLHTNLGQMSEAVKYAKTVIGMLDEPVPDEREKLQEKVGGKIGFIQSQLENKVIEDLAELPIIEDENKLALMNILVKSVPPAYQTDQDLVGLIITMMVETSLKYGNSPFSSYGYDMYAILVGGALQDYPASFRFGKIAMKLVNDFDAVALKGAVYFVFANFVSHWGQPLQKSLDIFKDGFNKSIEGGDYIHTGYCSSRFLVYSILHGHPLANIQDEAKKYINFLRKKEDLTCAEMSVLANQVASCFGGNTASLTSLDSDDFKEEAFLETFDLNLFSTSHFYLLKVMVSYLHDDYEEAFRLLPLADGVMHGSAGSHVEAAYNFYNSMVHLALFNQQDEKGKNEFIEKVKTNQERMKMWADSCPENYLHLLQLVEAQKTAVEGKYYEAIDMYLKCIESAHHFMHLEALANELLAKHWLHQNKILYSKQHLEKASYLYQRWGAKAKVEQLEKKYPGVLGAQSTSNTMHTTVFGGTRTTGSTSIGQSLDINTILKASQVLSKEVKINRLIETMLRIVVENTGAERGIIIENSDDKLWFKAEVYNQKVNIMKNKMSINDYEQLPLSVINHVVRRKEEIVIDNASTDGKYSTDNYIKENNIKSVLCYPVFRKKKLSFLFYLENNLMSNTFTSERLELLNILSSQIAISIENALLYQNLEQKVEERTEKLQDALKDVRIKNKHIMDSIRCAERIQHAILVHDSQLADVFSDHFILFKPKDIVSGDFYWFSKIGNTIFMAVVDCTGHGVPGAFMSMIGNTLLNEIVNEKHIHDPVDILNMLHTGVRVGLNHEKSNNNDGMDVCLCKIESKGNGQRNITFAGAKRPLYYINNGELNVLKGTRKSIGGWNENKDFSSTSFTLQNGDALYLCTDGFADTPNKKRKSFTQKKILKIIQEHFSKPFNTQKEMLEKKLHSHQEGVNQRDDITLIGLKL